MSEAIGRGHATNNVHVGGVGGSEHPTQCLEESERLDEAVETLDDLEHELASKLKQAIAGTIVTGIVCANPASRASCASAVAQHFARLWEIDGLVERYEQEAREYEAALSDHLACLARPEEADE